MFFFHIRLKIVKSYSILLKCDDIFSCEMMFNWGSYNRGQIAASRHLNFTSCGTMRQPRYSISRLRVAGIHDSRDIKIISKCFLYPGYLSHFSWPGYKTTAIQKLILCYFCDFCIAAVVFPGFREKKRNAAKYPQLYSPV